jgi:uncharacterized membrane protein YecN with MAPEG domain
MNERAINFALPVAAIYIALVLVGLLPLTRVAVGRRRARQVGIGDGGNRELARAIRLHANYVENVAFSLGSL